MQEINTHHLSIKCVSVCFLRKKECVRQSERDREKRGLLSPCLPLHYTPLLVAPGTDLTTLTFFLL